MCELYHIIKGVVKMDITKVLEVLSKYIVDLENKIELKDWEIEKLKEDKEK